MIDTSTTAGKITKEMLVSIFDYFDGALLYKVQRGKCKPGDMAGTVNSNGYLVIWVNNKPYKAHRLIFLYHHGYMPKLVDHKDRVRLNNYIHNLRECTASQNSHNAKLRKDNKSGVKGVFWNNKLTRWQANIYKNNKQIYVGVYKELEAAKAGIREARKELHGEFCNHGDQL